MGPNGIDAFCTAGTSPPEPSSLHFPKHPTFVVSPKRRPSSCDGLIDQSQQPKPFLTPATGKLIAAEQSEQLGFLYHVRVGEKKFLSRPRLGKFEFVKLQSFPDGHCPELPHRREEARNSFEVVGEKAIHWVRRDAFEKGDIVVHRLDAAQPEPEGSREVAAEDG